MSYQRLPDAVKKLLAVADGVMDDYYPIEGGPDKTVLRLYMSKKEAEDVVDVVVVDAELNYSSKDGFTFRTFQIGSCIVDHVNMMPFNHEVEWETFNDKGITEGM